MYIHENNKKHLPDFIRLNEEWITSHFEIEDVDLKLAANPGKIIEDGGYIFTLISDNEVVGACALFKENDNSFELARMAVSQKHQGQGFGKILIETCLDKLKSIQAQKVFLVSNTKLKTAISLYKKHGFKITTEGQHPLYSRANIVMEKNIQS